MAYSSSGTPRFYINVLEWLNNAGVMELPNIFRTLPVVQENFVTAINGFDLEIPPLTAFVGAESGKGFIAILGHTLHSAEITYGVTTYLSQDNIINGSLYTPETVLPNYDGWSLTRVNLEGITLPENLVNFSTDAAVAGSIIVGTYYDMPHSPDLKLTMSREYGGTKTLETRGGSTLSNTTWTKPPKWGNLGAWELHENNYVRGGNIPLTSQKLSRSGRRIWDLSFSYLEGKDAWGSNQSVFPVYNHETGNLLNYSPWGSNPSGMPESDLSSYNIYQENLFTSDDFYSQVIHKTNGGQLPFIFQADKTSISIDSFAICKLDMNSIRFDQVANGVYNVKLKIREVW